MSMAPSCDSFNNDHPTALQCRGAGAVHHTNCCHLRRSNTVAINLVGDSIKNSDHGMLRHSTEQQRGERTYPPLNTLKLVAEDVWIVDGPVIRFGMSSWPKMLFPTRMTIIRVAGGNLFIHSPTP